LFSPFCVKSGLPCAETFGIKKPLFSKIKTKKGAKYSKVKNAEDCACV